MKKMAFIRQLSCQSISWCDSAMTQQDIIDWAILDALEKGELDLDEQMEANFTKDMENGTFVLDMSEYNE